VSRQLVGAQAFGASGFRYCGSLLNSSCLFASRDLAAQLTALVEGVAGTFGLTGVGCIDVIVTPAGPVPLEVNPRWSSSMELVERAFGLSVFRAHAEACRDAALPPLGLADVRGAPVVGKAVVFARQHAVATAAAEWLADRLIADVPHAGEAIAAGQPVCTVFAEGPDDAACVTALEQLATRVYDRLLVPVNR
jgi:predicted ATP-grasp superfamily ATP-dependent carboligase